MIEAKVSVTKEGDGIRKLMEVNATGTVLDLLADTIFLVREIYSNILSSYPDQAEAFRLACIRAVSDPASHMWDVDTVPEVKGGALS